MEYRHLGASGLRVSALGLGTMTFGGRERFAHVGSTDSTAATRQVDVCLDAGINFVDTADVYSAGLSEEILGAAIAGGATASCSRRRRACGWATGRTTPGSRATT